MRIYFLFLPGQSIDETTTKMIMLHFTNMYPLFRFLFLFGNGCRFSIFIFFFTFWPHFSLLFFLIIELPYESFNLYNNQKTYRMLFFLRIFIEASSFTDRSSLDTYMWQNLESMFKQNWIDIRFQIHITRFFFFYI